MIWIIILIGWVIAGIITDIIVLFKSPIIIVAGWALLPMAVIGIIIWPYVLYTVLTDDSTGGWI